MTFKLSRKSRLRALLTALVFSIAGACGIQRSNTLANTVGSDFPTDVIVDIQAAGGNKGVVQGADAGLDSTVLIDEDDSFSAPIPSTPVTSARIEGFISGFDECTVSNAVVCSFDGGFDANQYINFQLDIRYTDLSNENIQGYSLSYDQENGKNILEFSAVENIRNITLSFEEPTSGEYGEFAIRLDNPQN